MSKSALFVYENVQIMIIPNGQSNLSTFSSHNRLLCQSSDSKSSVQWLYFRSPPHSHTSGKCVIYAGCLCECVYYPDIDLFQTIHTTKSTERDFRHFLRFFLICFCFRFAFICPPCLMRMNESEYINIGDVM